MAMAQQTETGEVDAHARNRATLLEALVGELARQFRAEKASVLAANLEEASQHFWREVAKAAGVNEPSTRQIALVVACFRGLAKAGG